MRIFVTQQINTITIITFAARSLGVLRSDVTRNSGRRTVLNYRSAPKGRPSNAQRKLLTYSTRSKHNVFLLSAAQSIANLFVLEAGPPNLIWPSFGITTVHPMRSQLSLGVRNMAFSTNTQPVERREKDATRVSDRLTRCCASAACACR
jgi:hypothetical protein